MTRPVTGPLFCTRTDSRSSLCRPHFGSLRLWLIGNRAWSFCRSHLRPSTCLDSGGGRGIETASQLAFRGAAWRDAPDRGSYPGRGPSDQRNRQSDRWRHHRNSWRMYSPVRDRCVGRSAELRTPGGDAMGLRSTGHFPSCGLSAEPNGGVRQVRRRSLWPSGLPMYRLRC